MVRNIDYEATVSRVDAYRQQNAELISRNKTLAVSVRMPCPPGA